MTAVPFGASCATPPAPTATTPNNDGARAVHHSTTLQDRRAAQIADAWSTVIDRDADDATLARACRTLIRHCRDPRRDTARDLLALLGPDP